MRHIFIVSLAALLVATTARANTFEAQCLNQKSKFSNCKVSVEANTLTVEYKNKKDKELNVNIPGEKIMAINAGQYSKRNVAAGLLLSPVFLLTKRKSNQISVEYTTESNKTASIIFQVKEKYGLPLKSQLQVLSGKVVQEEGKRAVDVEL